MKVILRDDVKNTGAMDGDEVVEVYLTQPKASATPLRQLVGFKRLHLKAGDSAHISMTIEPRSLGQVDDTGNRVILPGDYSVSLGGAQPQDSAAVQTGQFKIAGTAKLPK